MSEAPHVLVLGAGGAGMTAAIAAGALVSLFDKGEQVGGTIAPGMVFGYLAGRHAAGLTEEIN